MSTRIPRARNAARLAAAMVLIVASRSSAWAGGFIMGSMTLDPAGVAVVDAVKNAKFSVKSTNGRGSNGIQFQFNIAGATLAGAKANFTAEAAITLRINGGTCDEYVSPSFQVANGSGKVKFTASDVGIPEGANDISICTVIGQNPGGIRTPGFVRITSIGFLQGNDSDP